MMTLMSVRQVPFPFFVILLSRVLCSAPPVHNPLSSPVLFFFLSRDFGCVLIHVLDVMRIC